MIYLASALDFQTPEIFLGSVVLIPIIANLARGVLGWLWVNPRDSVLEVLNQHTNCFKAPIGYNFPVATMSRYTVLPLLSLSSNFHQFTSTLPNSHLPTEDANSILKGVHSLSCKIYHGLFILILIWRLLAHS